MQTRPLGKTHIEITPIVLGTWAIGGFMWGGTDEKQSIAAIHASIDAGVTTIDTAPIYGMGLSEQLIGRAIRGHRHKVIIATKCGLEWTSCTHSEAWNAKDHHGKPFIIRRNLKPQRIIQECEDSLKRLGTDVIDLYQIHWPDSTTPIEDAWGTMVKLKEQGKVKAIGVSNFDLEQLKQVHALSPVTSLQPPYSLIRKDIEKEIVPFCLDHDISIIVYSPLERGLLTGKLESTHTFPPLDHRRTHPPFFSENLLLIQQAMEQIRPIAQRHRATIAQVILQCTIHRPAITAALVGARTPAQATENAHAAALQLDPEEVALISHLLSAKELQRPLYEG